MATNRAAWWFIGLGAVAGCGPAAPSLIAPPPPPLDWSAPVALVPGQVVVSPSQTAQFQAMLGDRPAPPDEFAWTIADTSLGQMAATGLLTAVSCYRAGTTSVQAIRTRNPSQRAAAAVTVVVPAVGLVQIQAINRASDHEPVELDRIVGTVEIIVQANSAVLCVDVTGIQLTIGGPRGDSLLPVRDWSLPTRGLAVTSLPWDTAIRSNDRSAFPDGPYSVGAVLYGEGGLRLESNRIPVRVVNQSLSR